MSTRIAAGSRPRHPLAVLGALVVAATVMGGCSSSDGDFSSDSAATGYAESGGAEAYGGDEAYSDTGMDAAEGTAANEDQADDRALIVTGSVYMTVEDPIAAADDAALTVTEAGGRVDSRSETAPRDGEGGSAWLTLRIPAQALEDVVDQLRDIGTVDEFTTQSADVTREVADLDAQISTLRASTARIQALLDDAEDIKDIITLEDELDGRQAELESLKARQRGLDDQVSLSTIELSLTTDPVIAAVEEEPDTFLSGLAAGWGALAAFLSGALVTFGVVLPWLAAMGIIAVVVLAIVRSRRSRRSDAPSSST